MCLHSQLLLLLVPTQPSTLKCPGSAGEWQLFTPDYHEWRWALLCVVRWPCAAIKARSSQPAQLFPPHFAERDALHHVAGSARSAAPLPHLRLLQDGTQPLHRGETFWGNLWWFRTSKVFFLDRDLTLFCLCFSMQDIEASDGLYSLLSLDQKRDSEDFIFRRPLSKCHRKNKGCSQELIRLNTVHLLGTSSKHNK